MIRVADCVHRFLVEMGIRDVFSVTGGGSIFLTDALHDSTHVKAWFCHHEQAATMAAESYARVTGGLGVCVLTLGPGSTNSITGVAGAWMDSVPVMVISGQSFSSQTVRETGLRQLGIQEFPIVPVVQSFTKYAVTVEDPARIRFELEKAAFLSEQGRPGPVWVEIPANVQSSLVVWDELDRYDPPSLQASPSTDEGTTAVIRDVVALLIKAERPLMQVGNGVRIAKAIPTLRSVVEEHEIPFITSHNSNDLVASDHPQRIGFSGIFGQRAANFAVQTCDLLISVGNRFSLGQTGYRADDYARNATVVMVDIDQSELSKAHLRIDLPVHMDAGDFLRAFDAEVPADYRCPDRWVAQLSDWRDRYRVADEHRPYSSSTEFVNSYAFVEALSDELTPTDIIVTDMGLAYQSAHQALIVKDGQRFFTNTGLAPMGWGLPAAVGAAVAAPASRVICLAGDGGFMMNLQELATVAYHNLPVKIFIFNNRGYLTIKQTQEIGFASRSIGVDATSGLGFPDFSVVAEAFGIPNAQIHAGPLWRSELRSALNSTGPFLVDVAMDPDQVQAPKAIGRVRPDGTREQSVLEDLWPFLSQETLVEEIRIQEDGS